MLKIPFLKINKNHLTSKRNKFHRIFWLFLSCIFLASFILLIFYFSPTWYFPLLTIRITGIIFFFILLFLTLFSLVAFIFKSKIHGVLVGTFVIIYLIFRLNHLTSPFFVIMLLALFVTLELFASNKRD